MKCHHGDVHTVIRMFPFPVSFFSSFGDASDLCTGFRRSSSCFHRLVGLNELARYSLCFYGPQKDSGRIVAVVSFGQRRAGRRGAEVTSYKPDGVIVSLARPLQNY